MVSNLCLNFRCTFFKAIAYTLFNFHLTYPVIYANLRNFPPFISESGTLWLTTAHKYGLKTIYKRGVAGHGVTSRTMYISSRLFALQQCNQKNIVMKNMEKLGKRKIAGPPGRGQGGIKFVGSRFGKFISRTLDYFEALSSVSGPNKFSHRCWHTHLPSLRSRQHQSQQKKWLKK